MVRDRCFTAAPTNAGPSWSRVPRSACGGCRSSTSRTAISRSPTRTAASSRWSNGEIYNFERSGVSSRLADTCSGAARSRSHPARLRGMRAVVRQPAPRDVRDCLVGCEDAHAAGGTRSRRREAAVLRRNRGRLVIGSGDQGHPRGTARSRELDLVALDQFLTYEYVISPRTIFSAIRRLPAAHYLLTYRNGASRRRATGTRRRSRFARGRDEDAADALREALRRASSRR